MIHGYEKDPHTVFVRDNPEQWKPIGTCCALCAWNCVTMDDTNKYRAKGIVDAQDAFPDDQFTCYFCGASFGVEQ